MSQASLWTILETCDILNTGVSQVSVLSPLLFSLFINALSKYLDDIGCIEKVSHGLPNITHSVTYYSRST